MSPEEPLSDATPTLSFDKFWEWLITHPNCILRVGTPDAVIFDDEDYHWHFVRESSETVLVQVIRGKRLVGEILIPREQIAYVQGALGEQEGEFVFELIAGGENDQSAVYYFVLSHGFEQQSEPGTRRIH